VFVCPITHSEYLLLPVKLVGNSTTPLHATEVLVGAQGLVVALALRSDDVNAKTSPFVESTSGPS
jgi:hypothetical protein